jgi:cytochrome P450
MQSPVRSGGRVAPASTLDTIRVAAAVAIPNLAQGIIRRRPSMVWLAERLDVDRRAGRLLQRLRRRHGPGPLRLPVPRRSVALVLSTDDLRRILDESPEPFALDTREKHAALSHFQPDGVLISRGALRQERRRVNEAVLDTPAPLHRLADAITAKVRDETARLLAESPGRLDYARFSSAFWRIIRRVTLGDAARDDHETTDLLNALRSDANWAFLRPPRTALRDRFLSGLARHMERAEPGSLASLLARAPTSPQSAPIGQLPHWLFAFDAAGIAAYRALALLATHPLAAEHVRSELAAGDPAVPRELPYLRACVLESLRLWPTTLAVLRESTSETSWDGTTLPAGTAFIIVSSFFHRDDETLPYADRFAPETWLAQPGHAASGLIPFSAGPGACPGRNLVLHVTSTLLAALLDQHDYRLTKARLDHRRPLPRTLDHFTLRFAVTGRGW